MKIAYSWDGPARGHKVTITEGEDVVAFTTITHESLIRRGGVQQLVLWLDRTVTKHLELSDRRSPAKPYVGEVLRR